MAGRQANQAVTPVFLSAYCGSGLVIQVFARRQPTSSRWSASRMVSRLTRSAVIPCSAQTSAARASVQVERALPNWRGLWCKSAFSRWLRSASKSLAAVCGRRDCRATTANPRVSNARRTLCTACGLQPTAWAMTVVVSPRAEAKSMWQRRTVNPSDDRRPACKAWRSGPLNSRTKRGFIPQHMTQARHPNNVRWNCTRPGKEHHQREPLLLRGEVLGGAEHQLAAPFCVLDRAFRHRPAAARREGGDLLVAPAAEAQQAGGGSAPKCVHEQRPPRLRRGAGRALHQSRKFFLRQSRRPHMSQSSGVHGALGIAGDFAASEPEAAHDPECAPGEDVRLRTLTGRPCRDVGRIILLDGVHRWAQRSASSTLGGTTLAKTHRAAAPCRLQRRPSTLPSAVICRSCSTTSA